MAISYLLFTAGFVFALMMQFAVYNKKSLVLNATIMKSNKGSSLFQTIIITAALGLPIIINSLLITFFSANVTYTIMLIIGVLFILTHRIWINNIYERMMKRRYINMEGFRETR